MLSHPMNDDTEDNCETSHQGTCAVLSSAFCLAAGVHLRSTSADGKLHARSFCRGCIEPAVLSPSGQHVCPACVREGSETFLGRDPFAAQRLQPDFNVDAIIRKLLPPDVRWHLDRMQCRVRSWLWHTLLRPASHDQLWATTEIER